jgi:hypothetical protein
MYFLRGNFYSCKLQLHGRLKCKSYLEKWVIAWVSFSLQLFDHLLIGHFLITVGCKHFESYLAQNFVKGHIIRNGESQRQNIDEAA